MLNDNLLSDSELDNIHPHVQDDHLPPVRPTRSLMSRFGDIGHSKLLVGSYSDAADLAISMVSMLGIVSRFPVNPSLNLCSLMTLTWSRRCFIEVSAALSHSSCSASPFRHRRERHVRFGFHVICVIMFIVLQLPIASSMSMYIRSWRTFLPTVILLMCCSRVEIGSSR